MTDSTLQVIYAAEIRSMQSSKMQFAFALI